MMTMTIINHCTVVIFSQMLMVTNMMLCKAENADFFTKNTLIVHLFSIKCFIFFQGEKNEYNH